MIRRPAITALVLLAVLCVGGSLRADEPEVDDWRHWASINAAIDRRDLDGPDDIIEKAEIIEDRVDALDREGKRIASVIEDRTRELDGLRRRREMFEELTRIQRGGDDQTVRRLADLNEQLREAERRLDRARTSETALQNERNRLMKLASEYRHDAQQLKEREAGGK